MRWLHFLAFFGVVFSSIPGYTAEWGEFRGPNGRGIGEGKPPATWDVTSGENILWKQAIPGLSHASPIIAGDRLFLVTAISESGKASLKTGLYGNIASADDKGEWQWQLLCLRPSDGQLLWQQSLHSGVPEQGRHLKASHANSTPATDGRYVVTMLGSEGLFCHSVEGELQWKKSFGTLRAGFFQAPSTEWGFASSPVIHDNRVILQCDTLNLNFVVVLDLESGEEQLRISRDDVPTWSTPSIYEGRNQDYIICNGYKEIAAYDFETGERIWHLKGGGDIPIPRPIVKNDLIYITNAHGGMSPIYAIQSDAKGNITPTSDGRPPEGIEWWYPREGSYIPTPIAYQGILYVVTESGILSTFDAKTGNSLYSQRLVPGRGVAHSASPVAAGGHLYIASEQGEVRVVDAGRQYERRAINDMREPCMATPAIAGDRLFIRTQRHLYAIGK